ncbi:type-2 protein geranylgeranyltransferase subunit beta [Ascobolus immersus RN42]|uniref:Geranylgeranyl transferase type-2 subunit beta n=1 Tax=Ascobolus immersus RN42 TaxID=1160509 RepID=A0A3N4IMI0_ASCIM|nr:type-2 protein geranylgeranyltransferase subunit beta [Ascobolus immersus RN42]
MSTESTLLVDKHLSYIVSLDTKKDTLEYWLTEHLRLSGLYWGLTALALLGRQNALPRDETIAFVRSCQHKNGGFGAAPGHDAHILNTGYAVQILALQDALDEFDTELIAKYVAALQNRETGAFAGDEWGETDTRFIYSAFNCLSLLGRLSLIDVPLSVSYILSCQNYDGGFGLCPGAESHAGQIFTCIGVLAIAGKLDLIDRDVLGDWLSERQLPNGGLNGRPEKLEDVCYSWWVLSPLAMIDRLGWIDANGLARFILGCQDPEVGGIADRPEDRADVFHTCFGITGLSLLGFKGLKEVDAVYCLPKDVVKRTFARYNK